MAAAGAAMTRGNGMRQGRRAGQRRPRLAREGQIVSRMFDSLGSRPQPTNGLTLEQSVTVELTAVRQTILTVASTPGLVSYAGLTFALSDFGAAATLATVFDQYRIDQLEVWIESTSANATISFPDLYTAVDLDDGNVPVALGNVADKLGSLVGALPGGHYHKWKPHIAVATYSGAFTSYSNQLATWIDCASPNVQHFGLKTAMQSNGSGYAVNAVVRAVISFRAPAIN